MPVLEAGLDVAALVFLPLLALAPRGLAPLACMAALLGVGLIWTRGGLWAFRSACSAPLAILMGLALWGAISAAWSPNPTHSLVQSGRLAGLLVAACVAMPAAQLVSAPRRLAGFMLVGFIAAIIIAVIDLATAGAASKPFSTRVYQTAWLNQASDAFAILLLPTTAALIACGYRWAGCLFAIVGGIVIFALAGTSAKTAFVAAAPFAIFCYFRRAPVARVAAVLAVVAILTAPLTFARLERASSVAEAADWVKFSAAHRLLIWSFVGDRIAEHPLRGWGLEASRAIPGGREPSRTDQTWLPLHPHNAPLQIWLELGVPGAVLVSLLIGWFWLTVAAVDWPPVYAAAACGSLMAAFVASAVTYGIWQEWWQGTLAFALFLILVLARVAASAGRRA